MKQSLKDTLVLCDLDTLMLAPDGNLAQVVREVLNLFMSRGGRLTVFSQRTPRAVRTILGSVRLSAPALVCGGTLVYSFSSGAGRALAGFEALNEDFLHKLPAAPGVGIALQMKDGSTRVLRMSRALEEHLNREWTPYLLGQPEAVSSADVLRVLLYKDEPHVPVLSLFEKALAESAAPLLVERLSADCLALVPQTLSAETAVKELCEAAGMDPGQLAVVAGSQSMVRLMGLAGESAAASDAPAEVRVAAKQALFCTCAGGAAAEYLYRLIREAEGSR